MTERRARRALLTVSIAVAAMAASVLPSAAASAATGTSRPAARPAPAAALRRASAPGVITGVVHGPAGTPLRGVCVTASGPAGTRNGLTTASGRYTITGLRPGSYAVGYRDCADPARYFEQWYGSADLPASAARVSVRTGLPVRLAAVTLRLTSPAAEIAATRRAALPATGGVAPAAKSGWITGTARSSTGRKLSGICAMATSSTADSVTGTGTVTGRKGGYSLYTGTSGKWEVQFVGGCGGAGNWAPQWWRYDQTDRKVTYLHAGKGHGFSGINGSLRPGAAISGTVTAAVGGAPLKGVCVTAAGTGGMGQVEVQGVTASNGSYRLPDLGTGSYRVRFDPSCGQRGNYLGTKHAALVRATDGKTTKGIDAHLQPGASISGVVTSQANGTPVAGICVDLAKSAGAIDGLDEVYTNASGEYTFSQLRAGSYVVGYTGGCGNTGSYAPVYYDGQVSPATATPIPVAAAQQVTGINEAMPAGGTIAGTVTRSSGASLKDVCVVTTSRNYAGGLGSNPFLLSEFAAEADESDLAFTGKNGTYRIPNMPPGQYQTAFFGGCGNGTASYAARTFAPQGGTGWVSVGAGTTTSGVSAALSVGGSISGTVTGTAGRKLGGICVMAVSKAEPAVLTAEAYSEPISSGDGRYVLPGLPAGRYAVDFTPCFGPAYGPQWYKGVAGQSSARLVTVRTGHASTGINAALTAGGTLTGKVTAKATGKPVANVCVLITDSDGNPVAGALTAANGIYRLVHVPAGRWTVDPDPCESANPALGGIVRKDVRTHGASTSLALTLPKAGQVTGTVLGGTPAAAEPDLCVEATPATGDGEPGIAVTGADGGYDLTGLAPGQYLIAFTPYCLPGTAAVVPQWYNNAAPKVNETPVTVTGGKVTSGVGATLVSDGGISGTVTVSSAPAAGVCVGAYDGPASTPAEVAITGANGSYQLAGLTPGSYSVEFTAGCGAASYTTQWYSGVTTRAAASTITVDPGSVTSGIDAS